MSVLSSVPPVLSPETPDLCLDSGSRRMRHVRRLAVAIRMFPRKISDRIRELNDERIRGTTGV